MTIATAELNQLLKCNPFELFNIKAEFNIDLDYIRREYLSLQKKYHPDNSENNEELKSSLLMLSSHINDAFNVLKTPLDRSIKLLEIMGSPLNLSTDTSLPANFLMSQMELHEQIEDAIHSKSIASLEQIEAEIKEFEYSLIQQIEHNFAINNLNEVKSNTKQLAFYNKVKATLSSTIMNLI